MTAFIVGAIALCVLAAAMLTRSLWWPFDAWASISTVDALGQQLRQLKTLHTAGALTDQQYLESSEQVERRLRALLSATDSSAPSAVGVAPSAVLSSVLVFFLFAVAAGGYALVGSPGQLDLGPSSSGKTTATSRSPQEEAHPLTPERVSAMIDQLAERLKNRPDDASGWEMLARSYVLVGKHAQAVDAFRQALRLQPDDAGLMVDFADALAVTKGRSLEGEPTELVARALKIDPRNSKGLALAGTAAFNLHDYKEAVRQWEMLVQVETAQGPIASEMLGSIAQARELAGMPPAASAAPADGALSAEPSSARSSSVSGTVTLAKSLAGRVSPDDTLFVFARAVDGPRVPLAILRKRVRDLPLQFTLDDSMAMSPESKLSGAERVIVGARISKSGNAMPKTGDLQGLSGTIAVGASGFAVEIDQEVAR